MNCGGGFAVAGTEPTARAVSTLATPVVTMQQQQQQQQPELFGAAAVGRAIGASNW
jgi:hypothetical protein